MIGLADIGNDIRNKRIRWGIGAKTMANHSHAKKKSRCNEKSCHLA